MFFTKNKSGEVTLVVEVGSSSVGAALVSASKGVAPKVLFSTRQPVAMQDGDGKSRSLTTILSTLESVLKLVSAEHVVVHKTHVIFSSPWYVSQTKIVQKNYDKPTSINHRIVEQITGEIEKKFSEELGPSKVLVEHRVVRAKLNGYLTSNPYHKKTKIFELAFFSSAVDKDVFDSVHNLVAKYFHIRNNQVSSFSVAAFSTISGVMPNERDFMIVDVRGEVTDVSLVSDGALIKSLSFPQGKNALIKAIADSSGQSPVTALSMFNVVKDGVSDAKTQSDIAKFTAGFKQNWLQAYSQTCKDLSVGTSVMIISQPIFLIADNDIETFFEQILNEAKTENVIHKLKHLNLKDYLESTSVLSDYFLALESIFVTMI